ncbi:ectoine synthase [Calothrix rhizosoleniae]|uniref:ectoine synthase n=1 Tax=Calothrix rhizosoleniae TaxID=888997 RepID=UPI000B497308|nr:ectoine synthase [Calothrix rhizosoleniae]
MIIRTIQEAKKTERHIIAEDWETIRLLLKGDGMGFSFSVTTINAGRESPPRCYQHHLEAVLVIEGEGEIELLDENKIYPLSPGTFYALDKHDHYILLAKTKMQAICVFNPPLSGKEIHDEEGSYPAEAEEISV